MSAFSQYSTTWPFAMRRMSVPWKVTSSLPVGTEEGRQRTDAAPSCESPRAGVELRDHQRGVAEQRLDVGAGKPASKKKTAGVCRSSCQ